MANDVTKLPKWAQDRIRHLESTVAHLRETIRMNDEGDTQTTVGDYQNDFVHVSDHTRIRFYDEDGDYIEASWGSDHRGVPVVEVRAGASRKMHLLIEPVATNFVRIRQVDL